MAIHSNKVKCNVCGDIIESVHRHDFKWCSCKNVAVDGGLECPRRCFKTDNFEDLSVYDIKTEEDLDY